MKNKIENKKTLLVLAAGMGSRFGGLKQIEPIDKNGNFIIDYSIFDALRAGFSKVVFVIREKNLDIFRNTIGNRISKYIEVDYAFQEKEYFVPSEKCENREKPWGTAHAVLCCKDKIEGDFLVINADDFYGFKSYELASKFMRERKDEKEYANIVYKLSNTLTSNGAVKRGVCYDEDGVIKKIVECSVEQVGDKYFASPLQSKDTFEVDKNQHVSMNFLCLNSNFFEALEREFDKFINNSNDLLKDECLIQEVMFSNSKVNGVPIKVLESDAIWYGVTYKEDKENLVNSIQALVDAGEYPANLWQRG